MCSLSFPPIKCGKRSWCKPLMVTVDKWSTPPFPSRTLENGICYRRDRTGIMAMRSKKILSILMLQKRVKTHITQARF